MPLAQVPPAGPGQAIHREYFNSCFLRFFGQISGRERIRDTDRRPRGVRIRSGSSRHEGPLIPRSPLPSEFHVLASMLT